MNWFAKIFTRHAARGTRSQPPASKFEMEQRQLQQRIALASVTSDHPLWLAVLEIVDDHERNMMTRVLEENLSAESRAYNAGLAASAEYLANALRDLKAAADREMKQRKTEE